MSLARLEEINLHLDLSRRDSMLMLMFNPNRRGNKRIQKIIDESYLRIYYWKENIPQWMEEAPEIVFIRLIKRAYTEVPFLKDVAKAIVHYRAPQENVLRLASIAEFLKEIASEFSNLSIRAIEYHPSQRLEAEQPPIVEEQVESENEKRKTLDNYI